MTIEEMVDLVAEHVPMRGNGEDLAAPIMAALRAGQAMRLSFQFNEDGYVINDTDLIETGKAWDAATGDVE